jgi:hypothetical protein
MPYFLYHAGMTKSVSVRRPDPLPGALTAHVPTT